MLLARFDCSMLSWWWFFVLIKKSVFSRCFCGAPTQATSAETVADEIAAGDKHHGGRPPPAARRLPAVGGDTGPQGTRAVKLDGSRANLARAGTSVGDARPSAAVGPDAHRLWRPSAARRERGSRLRRSAAAAARIDLHGNRCERVCEFVMAAKFAFCRRCAQLKKWLSFRAPLSFPLHFPALSLVDA